MSKWPHTKTSRGVASDCGGVCERERDAGLEGAISKNLQPLSPSEAPFSLGPTTEKNKEREREKSKRKKENKTIYSCRDKRRKIEANIRNFLCGAAVIEPFG